MSEIVERLKEAHDWMRRPDSDESFSVADLERWLNNRPVTAFEDARATIATQAAKIKRLRAGGCARDQGTTQYCAEAAVLEDENAKLRAALEDIAYPNPVHGEDQLMQIARAALEGK